MLPLYLVLPLVLSSDGVIIKESRKPGVTISHTGLEISEENAGEELFPVSQCQCHLRCVVQPHKCVGYSYGPNQTCRLAHRYSLGVPRSGAIYIYYLPNGLPEGTILKEDELYYYYYKTYDYNLTEARKQCLARPGFRLAQAKTQQTADIFRDIHDYQNYYIDLTRQSDDTFAWGDGTVLQSEILKTDEPKNKDATCTNVGLYWDMWHVGTKPFFKCFPKEKLNGYLCQANYGDQPW